MIMESVEAAGFRRLFILVLQCWSVELLQLFLKQRGALDMCFLEASVLWLCWDGII